MSEQSKVQHLLITKFAESRLKNNRFSVRSFSLRLGLSPSATNEIMKGQRRVSRKMAERIAEKLQLDPSERSDLLQGFEDSVRTNKVLSPNKDVEVETLKLNSDQFKLISEWIHFGILSLLNVKDFKSDVHWIADRLGVPDVEVRKALLRLQHLDLIKIDYTGSITRVAGPIRTIDDIKDLSLQQMHLNDLELAKKKIHEVDVRLRDFSNYTFPANPKSIARAKEILRRTQDELEELMNVDDAKDVYRVCMYLFPLTQTNN